MSRFKSWRGSWAMAGIGMLAAVWALAEGPVLTHVAALAPTALPSTSISNPGVTPTPQGLPEFRQIVRDNRASVVHINTKQMIHGAGSKGGNPFEGLPEDSPFRQFFRGMPDSEPEDREQQALGSGFIISSDGKILTNAHVVDGADTVMVRLSNNAEYQAKVLGKDKASDVALLKIDAKNLQAVKLGDSSKLEVGEWVLAIGSPFGLDYSATQGIVSALGRKLPNETYVPFIQTDVAVNPGNSGGPLFNTRGEVIGINSQIYSTTGSYAGLSFAIPINTVRNVEAQLEKHGRVTRGWLGVQIQPVTSELAQSFGLDRPRGALVGKVDKDSPAAKAGLESGDIITSFNGQQVEESGDLPELVGGTEVGSTAEMKILREGHEKTLQVKIGTLKDDARRAGNDEGGDEDSSQAKAVLNVSVVPLTAEQREQAGVREGGVLIAKVSSGPARDAGIQAGDIVLKVGGKTVESPAQFTKLVQDMPRGKPVAFLVQRTDGGGGRGVGRFYVAVTVPAK